MLKKNLKKFKKRKMASYFYRVQGLIKYVALIDRDVLN